MTYDTVHLRAGPPDPEDHEFGQILRADVNYSGPENFMVATVHHGNKEP